MNIPDKCPHCGNPQGYQVNDVIPWHCGSWHHANMPFEIENVCQSDRCIMENLKAENERLRGWVRDAYEEGYWDCHDRKGFDDGINTSEALKRLDGRDEP